MDLVPPALIAARYFATEQGVIESLQVKRETVSRELKEFVSEHTSEGGLLEDAVNDKGTVTRAGATGQLKVILDSGEPEVDAEKGALTRCIALMEADSKAGKAVQQAQVTLDERVISRYAILTEHEIKILAIEDKWFTTICAAIDEEIGSLSRRFAARVQNLIERYAKPLPDIERDVSSYGARVERHLKRMGLSR